MPPAHVIGYSGGSAIARGAARCRHPELVRSLVLVSTWARQRPSSPPATMDPLLALDESRPRPSERAMLEAFFLWIYTPRAHADGMVERFIHGGARVPAQAGSAESFQRQLVAFTWSTTPSRACTASRRGRRSCSPARQSTPPPPPAGASLVAETIPGAVFEESCLERRTSRSRRVPSEFNAPASCVLVEGRRLRLNGASR